MKRSQNPNLLSDDNNYDNEEVKKLKLGEVDVKMIDIIKFYIESTTSNDKRFLLTFILSNIDEKTIDLNLLKILLDHIIQNELLKLNNLNVVDSTTIILENDIIVLLLRLIHKIITMNINNKLFNEERINLIINCLFRLLRFDSHKVVRQSLICIISLVNYGFILNNNLLNDLIQLHILLLSDWDQGIRKLFIELLSIACPIVINNLLNNNNLIVDISITIQSIIRKYIYDRDARVRAQSIEGLVTLHNRGLILPFDLYQEAVSALHDDIELVREQALELITILAQVYPQRTVTYANTQMTLVEDAFSKICNGVRDHVISVRTKACRMLGKLKGVKESLLLDGFGKIELEYTPKFKKLNIRAQRQKEDEDVKKKTIQQKQMIMEQDNNLDDDSNLYQEGEGDISLIESERDALLYSGAVGTFVLGLEDQYKNVRMATIESICELNKDSELLSRKSVDYLIEMFNDEIDTVRIHAINSVSKISASSLKFDEEQLQIVLAILEDSNSDIRKAIRNLLSVIILSSAKLLHSTIRSLLINNLKKYRTDLEDIYYCLKELAKNHSKLTEFLIEELLRLERYIMPTEYKVDDEYYTGICIVIFNACENNSKIPNHLPKYMYKHYGYLKSKFPHLFPQLNIVSLNMQSNALVYSFASNDMKILKVNNQQQLNTIIDNNNSSAQDLMQPFINTFNQIRKIALQNEKLDPSQAMSTLRRELGKTTKSGDKYVNYFVQFMKLYCSCCQYFLDVIDGKKDNINIFKNVIYLTYKIQSTFKGLNSQLILQLSCTRFVTYLKYLLLNCERNQNFTIDGQPLLILKQYAFNLKHLTNENTNLTLTNSIQEIVTLLCEDNNSIDSSLLSKVKFFPSLKINDIGKMTMLVSKITSPKPIIEKALEYQSFISLPINVEAKLYGFHSSIHSLFLIVTFPDGTHSVFPIDHEKEVISSLRQQTLRKEISIRTEAWSEACMLDISIGCSYKTDISKEYDLYSTSNGFNNNNGSTSGNINFFHDFTLEGINELFVTISKPIQYLVYPKIK
ncbi:hypothetical protein ABK040_014708 [Willaertia magna]